MTSVEIEGVRAGSTRVIAHRDGCAAPIPSDALRIDVPILPRLPAGSWTVVAEGRDECRVISRGCTEVVLPSDEPVTVTLAPIDSVELACGEGFACIDGECVCQREACSAPRDCGSLDQAGYCDGNTVVWCDTLSRPGGPVELDCGADRTCGWRSSEVGFDCLDESGSITLTSLSEIVGGEEYQVLQLYGPAEDPTVPADHYSYCATHGNPSDPPFHCGIDIDVPRGTVLYAPANAVVWPLAGATGPLRDEVESGGAGDLRFTLRDGTVIIFGHTSRVDVGLGDVVVAGDPVGLSGSYDGPRLHIEVRAPDATTATGYRTIDPADVFEL
jgi:hypothetical protein